MHWTDDAFVLSVKPHGENATIASVLTRDNGFARGLVQGGNSRAKRPVWQQGNLLQVEWRARLADQLGQITGELQCAYSASCVAAPASLPYLQTLCLTLGSTLPEGHPYPALFTATETLLENIGNPKRAYYYAEFELKLLSELGFALDLSSCAATGQTTDLLYVSPRTGRAVSRNAAQGYEDRLLKYPAFLMQKNQDFTRDDIMDALFLTGYFLERWVLQSSTHPAMKARQSIFDQLRRAC